MARRAQAVKPQEEPNLFDFLEDWDFENAAALPEEQIGDADRSVASGRDSTRAQDHEWR